MEKRQGRKVTGTLYKRGAWWWASWQAFGKREARSTGIRVGERGSKTKAQEVLDGWISPYKAEEEAGMLAQLKDRHKTAAEKAEEAMAAIRAAEERIPLVDAWKEKPYNMSQQTRGRTSVHLLSPRNVRENSDAWYRFVAWVGETYGAGLAMQDVTPTMAMSYSHHLQAAGLTPSRHNFLILVCSVMYRLAGLPSPFASVPKLKKQNQQHREPFTREQVARLLAAAKGEWKGFIAVLAFTGLRAGDAATLTHESRKNGVIRVETGKTGAEVVLAEHPDLTRILGTVVDRRPVSKTLPLFPEICALYNEKGAHALSRGFESIMREALGETVVSDEGEVAFVPFDGTAERKQGVRRISRFGLHSFRHTLAHQAAMAGIPLGTVQRWLGHASPEITRVYADHEDARQRQRLVDALSLELPPEPSGAGAVLLPAPHPSDALQRIVEALEGMTADNWNEVRDEVVAMVKNMVHEQEGATR